MKLPPFSLNRLMRILERQENSKWGPDYSAAIPVNRDESSPISRPSVLYSPKLGRDLHLHSIPERMAALVALYNPAVIDIHEQHMLRCRPGPHPLAGHPLSKGLTLLPVPGTTAVARQFGLKTLRKHPRVIFSEGDRQNPEINCDQLIPFPYIGDLLLFLLDPLGLYAVNWTVKATPEGFFEPAPHNPLGRLRRLSKKMDRDDERHLLEEEYFRQVEIRTERIAASNFDKAVLANLTDLACVATKPEPLDIERREKLIARFKNLIGLRTTVTLQLGELTTGLSCSPEDAITVFLQSVWKRHIRVDLHKPILIDKPLVRERVDILDEYSNLFRRA